MAALVVVSIQDLRPNPQDVSAFYLEKMYQLQVNPNASRPSVPSAVDTPPAFIPPSYAVWVNSLWILSLAISLSCAMLATLLQQWSRRYIKMTQPKRCSPEKRARTRAFFADGAVKLHVSWVVDALPTLVHVSLFIFFAGLLIYLFNIDHTVFKVVVCWVALLSTVYGFITFMPMFRHDSPYYSPLSSTAWYLHGVILYTVLKVPEILARFFFTVEVRCHIDALRESYLNRILEGFDPTVEKAIEEDLSKADGDILHWTAEFLEDDDALETLIESIPGFYNSEVVKGKDIPESVEYRILRSLNTCVLRTFSSNSISYSIKKRRFLSCFNAADVALDSCLTGSILSNLYDVNWRGIPDSIEIGHFLKSWDKITEGRFAPYIRGIVAHIIAVVQERDDRWAALALGHLGVSDGVLQDYLAQGDSVLLANLIHYTRYAADHSELFSSEVMRLLSKTKFDACNTSPGLQHDFCVMWDQVVPMAQKEGTYSSPGMILAYTRHIYIALHRGTDTAPTTFSESTRPWDDICYPLCNIPGHYSHPRRHIDGLTIADAAPLPTAT
jgi:hypothetical protein